MTCEDASHLIEAYCDGELDGGRKAEVTAHLSRCAACQAKADDIGRLRRLIAGAARQKPSAGLEARIRGAIATERAAELPPQRLSRRSLVSVRQIAAGLVVSLASALAAWTASQADQRQDRLRHDLVSAHVRSLLQDAPVQVASADTHTVRPWFAGRIEFAPPVKDLSAQGFALAGGRLDYIGDHRVASLVYKRNRHWISLFLWPEGNVEGATAAPVSLRQQGYSILCWRQNGFQYAAVSDVDRAELRTLEGLIAGSDTP